MSLSHLEYKDLMQPFFNIAGHLSPLETVLILAEKTTRGFNF